MAKSPDLGGGQVSLDGLILRKPDSPLEERNCMNSECNIRISDKFGIDTLHNGVRFCNFSYRGTPKYDCGKITKRASKMNFYF